MVKFNVSILNRLKVMVFFVNAKYIHKHKHVISNKTVTKLFTILIKYFFPCLNPTNYLKLLFFHMENRIFGVTRYSLLPLNFAMYTKLDFWVLL